MKLKRRISLYYGSISLASACKSFIFFLSAPFEQTSNSRKKLHAIIQRTYFKNDTAIYSFGSARSALGAFLKSAGIGAGDEVLLSSYTCLAVPTGVVYAGATPVYADIDPITLNTTTVSVIAAITPRVKAIVVQHTLGKPAPLDEIMDHAHSRGILVIEDCALSIGSRTNNAYVGTTGDAAIFSMELSKTVSCGWGGILAVSTKKYRSAMDIFYTMVPEQEKKQSAKDLFQTICSAWSHHPRIFDLFGKYILHIGFQSKLFRRSTPVAEFGGKPSANFVRKMGLFQLQLARHQWKEFDKISAACQHNAAKLFSVMNELDLFIPGYPSKNEITVSPRISFLANDIHGAEEYFMKKGIELGRWFNGPLSPLPKEDSVFNYKPASYPKARFIAERIANLPCHSGINYSDMENISTTLRSYVTAFPGAVVTNKNPVYTQ